MPRVDTKKTKVSSVVTLRDWPKGTRKRGWGWLHDQIWFHQNQNPDGELSLYLDRNMLWTGGGTSRIHTFHMGDEDSAPHDHPWWFITVPLHEYWERVYFKDGSYRLNKVEAFMPHFRAATYRHMVLAPDKPIKTIVITGRVQRTWGFWPEPDQFIPYKEWTDYFNEG